MMTDQYEVTFVRLSFGEPQKVDGIIALGVFSEKEIDFLRSLSFAIVFVNSNQHNYEFDQVQVDFERGQEQMVSYLLDQKRYTGLGILVVFMTGPTDASAPTVWPPSGTSWKSVVSTIPEPSMWGKSVEKVAMLWPRRPWKSIPWRKRFCWAVMRWLKAL